MSSLAFINYRITITCSRPLSTLTLKE